MTTSSFYKCNFFSERVENLQNFLVTQEEILLKEHYQQNSKFEKNIIDYKCSFSESNNSDWSKPTAIICIKDNIKLLNYVLNNISNNKVFNYLNFIIVDDRSTEDIFSVCKNFPVSYLRVDNKKGFNFSMLNNIAAKIAWDKGSKNIILWNSDLFTSDENQIPELLKLHEENNSTISGTKLIYPEKPWDEEEIESYNIKSVFPNKLSSYRGTVQFGGSMFAFHTQLQTYFPNHFCRFKDKNFHLVSENKLDVFITGAFQIIDLKWFIEEGGLNPSLSMNFQDVDLCLRAYKQNKKIYYFGKNNYMYHDESVSISKSKNTNQFASDHIIYSKIWNQTEYIRSILKFED